MIEIKKTPRENIELVIGEKILFENIILVCCEQIEKMSASGSFCSECHFQFVISTHSQLEEHCSLPDHINMKCMDVDRKDKKNIIFETESKTSLRSSIEQDIQTQKDFKKTGA